MSGAPSKVSNVNTTNRILTFLRVSLHVLVAVLLFVGIASSGWNPLAICMAVPFALLYLAGTVAYNEGKRFPRAAMYTWLAAVLALWVVMALHAAEFVWLEFPLVILVSVVLPTWSGIAVAALLLAFTLSVTAPGAGIGGVVGPLLGTVLALLIYHSYRALRAEADHYKHLAYELQATHMELAAAEHASGVLEERARLSREVHDTIAQGLSSIVLLGRTLDKQITEPGAKQILDTIRATASDNLAEARRFVAVNAGPAEPLPRRLEELARGAEGRQQALGQRLTVDLNVEDVPEPAAGVIERVVREGLSNIVRHAGATRAVVTVEQLGDVATVDVFDNGRGITGPEGYGLRGLRARVAEVGGTLSVEGNVLAASIPLGKDTHE
ncbi:MULTISPECIES: sensor histidine kinase [Corynebacterium]|uniref:sensor histidine kinase n=1 Tax=Corynebacterium TaxID=1716 RepID=UPI0008FB2B0A|nr:MULTISPECIES: histidine kinase [Corynebacterium]MCQ4617101.1 sensor histidine kinase [Corynebacterium pseudogenitalium]MDK8364278.1 histidine kinase [Corynebacterium sp. UMB10119B]OIR41241.1 two-component sensor histidine kinase [Corynebacterium sp. NML120713]